MSRTSRLPVTWCAAALVVVSSSALYAVPPAPQLSFPANNATAIDTPPTVRWRTTSTAYFYTLQIARDANFLVSPRTFNNIRPDTQYTINGLGYSTQYYWKVWATDDTGAIGPASAVWNFTTIVNIPAAPLLTSPANFSAVSATNPTLTWDAAISATSYRVQVSTDPAFSSLTVNDSINTTSRSVSLEYGKTYFWRVYARSTAGISPWSTRWRFSTPQEPYASWPRHRDLVLNTRGSSGGAGVLATQYNFPVLVRLNPMTFGWFDSVSAGGADIRFARANGSKALPYEIERWVDGASNRDTAEVWVLLDTVKPNDTMRITMYWGNAAATTRSDPYRVFDSVRGFSHVWHMNETPTGTGTIKDRTQNLCHGTPYQMSEASNAVQGVIGRALDFDGVNDSIKLDTVRTFEYRNGMTVSAWVIKDINFTRKPYILQFSKTGDSSANKVTLGPFDNTTTMEWSAGRLGTPSAPDYLLSLVPIFVSAVYHKDAVSGRDSLLLFKDGELFAARSGYASAPFYETSTDTFMTVNYLGKNWGANRQNSAEGIFDGVIDEVQVSGVQRDTGWLRLAFQTQRIDQTALCYYPSFSLQPRDTFATYLDTARLSVIARGNNLSYLWSRSADGGSSWNPITGGTAALCKYKTVAADTALTKPRFRCRVATPFDTVFSAVCTLTVCPPIAISANPLATTVFVGSNASFSVTASGRSLSYLWYRRDFGGSWAPATKGTYTSNPYTFVTDSADTGAEFQCRVSSSGPGTNPSTVTSGSAALTLCYRILFADATRPRDTSVVGGTFVNFSVVVNAGRSTPTYQWERSTDGGSTWPNIVGTSSPTYTFKSDSSATENNYRYRCRVSNSCTTLVSSRVARLTVCAPARVDASPRDTDVAINQIFTFRVTASGAGLTYQWQKSLDSGATYYNVTRGTGGTTPAYSCTTSVADTGSRVRFWCIVSSTCGSTKDTSNYARVGVCFPAFISASPTALGVRLNYPASFSVVATGTNLAYQWYRKNLGGSWSPISGQTGPGYTIASAQVADSGASFLCNVRSLSCGSPVMSDSAVLRVYTPVAFSNPSLPADYQTPGGSYESHFKVIVTGSNPSYQWFRKRTSDADFMPLTYAPGSYYGFQDSELVLQKADVEDLNAQFRCVVTGPYNSITSRTATLSVCFIPVITLQPSNTPSLAPGDIAQFTVQASVAGTLRCQWYYSSNGGGSWTMLTGDTNSIYNHVVAAGENGYLYRCRLWSGPCTGYITTTRDAVLNVCSSVAVSRQPTAMAVIEGRSAYDTIIATGTVISYQWQRKTKAMGAFANVTGATTSRLTISTTTLSDDSTLYRCWVYGQCDSLLSNTAVLRVYRQAVAFFRVSNSGSGPWDTTLSRPSPDTVYFNDTSSGYIDTAIWHFSGSAVDSIKTPRSPPGFRVFTATSGMKRDTVRLIVTGPLNNRDTCVRIVNTYAGGSNPILISGRYLSPTQVEFALSSYSDAWLRDAVAPDAAVNGVILYYDTAVIPNQFSSSAVFKTYTVATMVARGTTYLDTLSVAPLSGADSVYGFVTRIKWAAPLTDSSAWDSANGCRVLMRDTTRAVNHLDLDSSYYLPASPWNTTVFRIDSTSTLDAGASGLDSMVAFWYRMESFTSSVQWWRVDTIKNRSSMARGGRFQNTVVDSRFNTNPNVVQCTVAVLGKNGLLSPKKGAEIQVGHARPFNPISLTGIYAGGIHLRWNPLDASWDSLRLWYSTAAAVPLGTDTVDTAIYAELPLKPSVSDSEAWLYGTVENTTYYFGAQAFTDGLWTNFEYNSICYITTPPDTSAYVRNTVVNDSTVFIPDSNKVRVYWHADLMGYDSLYLGVSIRQDYGEIKDSIIARLQDSSLAVNNIDGFSSTIRSTSGSYAINLDQINLANNGTLVFDANYYALLWLRRTGLDWTPPTDSSVNSYHVPPFVWQTTQWRFGVKPDTSFWANNAIRFITPMAYTNDLLSARIHEFTPDSAMLHGFIQVGQGISFMDMPGTDKFQIGFNCSWPWGYLFNDIRIYRWDSANGQWRVERNTGFDEINPIVYINTNDLRMPIIALIDTIPPQITILSDTVGILQPRTVVYDTFAVVDNLGDLEWSFYAEQGGELPVRQTTGTLVNGIDTMLTVIPLKYTSSSDGARALFIVDDGRYRDTANVSRRVWRDTNTLLSRSMSWVPWHVTCELDAPAINAIWPHVTDADGKYDPKQVRLFRFLNHPLTAAKAQNDKWLEYAAGRDSLFELRPGRLFWIKTRERDSFPLGRGKTLPLQLFRYDSVEVAANGWTDFALPHDFDMKIGDIIGWNNQYQTSTQIMVQVIPALQFYQWKDTLGWICDPLFMSMVSTLDSLSKVLSNKSTTGLTVYNPENIAFQLYIPAISARMSAYTAGMMGKRSAKSGTTAWALKILPRNDLGAPLNPVFCGFNGAVRAGGGHYAMPPSWPRQSVGVYDEQTGNVDGHRILGELRNGGASFLLAFRNDTACSRVVSFRLERVGAFPSGMRTAVYDPSSGSTVTVPSAYDETAIGIDGNSTAYRYLFVGDATYVASAARSLSVVKLALERVFPNPARSLVRIQYSVPFALGRVKFTVLDISGRTVWSRTSEERTLAGGTRECLWDGMTNAGRRVAAGVFIVRMEAFDEKGKSAGTFSRRLTFMP